MGSAWEREELLGLLEMGARLVDVAPRHQDDGDSSRRAWPRCTVSSVTSSSAIARRAVERLRPVAQAGEAGERPVEPDPRVQVGDVSGVLQDVPQHGLRGRGRRRSPAHRSDDAKRTRAST